MKKIVLIITVLLIACLWADAAAAQEDCRDIFGDLIPDCTCTNVAGDIISCTDGTIITPCCPGDDDDDDDGGNEGDDDDDSSGDDDDDDGGSGGAGIRELGRSPRGSVRPRSEPVDFRPMFNPQIVRVRDPHIVNGRIAPIRFQLVTQLLWSGDSKSFDPEDTITISIDKLVGQDRIHLERDTHYTVSPFEIKGNILIADIDLFVRPQFAIYVITTKYEQDFEQSYPLFLERLPSRSAFAGSPGPTERIVTFSRVKP